MPHGYHAERYDEYGDDRWPDREADPSDFLGISALLKDEEREARDKTRAFVEERIKPSAPEWWEKAHFSKEIAPEMARVACSACTWPATAAPARTPSPTASLAWSWRPATRACAASSPFRARSALQKFGSAEQKEGWLPRIAKGEAIGCFGLTESAAGSDLVGVKTFARKDGSDWIVDGSKRWIGMGPWPTSP